MPLPCRHFRPASITLNLELSTITGTRAMSGSAAIRLRNSTIARSESSRPSSMLTSMTWAPFSTCWRATTTASSRRPSRISFLNCAEPVTLVRSPTLMKLLSGVICSGSRPLSRVWRGSALMRPAPRRRLHERGQRARRIRRHGLGDRGDVRRRGAAAAADQVEQAGLGELAQHRGHVLGRFVVAAERVGQAGVGMGADVGVGDLGEHVDVRAQVLGAERAVQADRQRLRMPQRVPERLGGLAGQRAAGGVGDRAGDHHRQARAARVERFLDREQRGLGIERVEHGLDHQHVGAAVDQAVGGFAIGHAQFVEGDRAEARAVHVGAQRGGAAGRAEHADDEARTAGSSRLRRHRRRRGPGARRFR